MRTVLLAMLLGSVALAQQPSTNYDEAKVPAYNLPELLLMDNGIRVSTAADWTARRAEIRSLLETEMFGRAPGRPKEMRFEIDSIDKAALGGKAIRKQVSIYISRKRLAGYLERVVFTAGVPGSLAQPFDDFDTQNVPLQPDNEEDALLASGTIPLLCTPVRDIAGAPPGNYWDGALVDYHLLLPYERVTRAGHRRRIVLYPHFNDYVTPGWLDKHLPWRKAPRGHPWLDDMLLVAPSPGFLATLPNGKLPDRQDFYRYGRDHTARIRAWERAIGECGRFAEAVMRWLERPDPSLLQPI